MIRPVRNWVRFLVVSIADMSLKQTILKHGMSHWILLFSEAGMNFIESMTPQELRPPLMHLVEIVYMYAYLVIIICDLGGEEMDSIWEIMGHVLTDG